jgi:hypothetical protein
MNETNLLLKRKIQLRRKQLELAKEYGLLFYRPHNKQDQFHSAGDFKFRLARCGNRFGKSDMGVSEDLAWALGERPWYDKNDPRRYVGIPQRATKGLIIAADWDKVDEIFTGDGKKGNIGKIYKKIPKHLITGIVRNHTGVICQMQILGLYGLSTICFDTRKSFATNPMGSESSDWDWIHVDEPIAEAHWKAVSRGLVDRGGSAWFTCTLLEQPWIQDFFFPSQEESKQSEYIQIKDGRKVRWVITGTIWDNPHLSKADIADFLESLTPEERDCRERGIPLHLSGLVYKEFEPQKHVLKNVPHGWKSYNQPPKDYSIWVRIDPHPRTPHAVLFLAISPLGQLFFYDEIFEACVISKLAEQIRKKTEGYIIQDIKMDPSAWIENPIDRTSMADEFERCGVYGIEKASKDLDRGILATKEYLSGQKGEIYFAPTLRTTIWEISRYAWADKQGVPTNKPVDKDDHMMENLRRFLIDEPYYIAPTNRSAPVADLSIGGDLSRAI